MSRPDEPLDVDFVVADDAEDIDEDLQLSELREWPRLRRARVPLATAAVIGIAAAAVVTVLNSQPQRSTQAAASPVPTASARATTPTPSGPVTAPYLPIRGRSGFPIVVNGGAVIKSLMIATGPDFNRSELVAAERCPKSVLCNKSPRVPMATSAALRRHFPRVHAIRVTSVLAHSEISGSILSARHITAHEGSVELAILIRKPTVHDPSTVDSIDDGRRTNAVFLILDGLAVEVEATAPRRDLPALAQLRRLAFDHGLLALD